MNAPDPTTPETDGARSAKPWTPEQAARLAAGVEEWQRTSRRRRTRNEVTADRLREFLDTPAASSLSGHDRDAFGLVIFALEEADRG